MKIALRPIALVVGLTVLPLAVFAHFKLLEPEKWTEKGPYSTWAAIQSPPQIPVLADGLFQHYPKPGEPSSALPKAPMAPWETDIQLPNITCPKCTLQVIQFMADHGYNQPGGYSYHHCADLQITADPAKPIDKTWSALA